MQKTYSHIQPIISLGLLLLTLLLPSYAVAFGGFPEEVDPLEISLASTPTGCQNGTDGSITVNIVGGTVPYNVEFSADMKRRTVYSSITVPGFVPGTYNVVVTDQLGEQVSAEITVGMGSAPAIPDSMFTLYAQDGCLAECQGRVEVHRQDGFIFRWNGRTLASDTIPRICAGDHVLTIERLDQNCIVNYPINLPEPPFEDALPQCPGDTTIQIQPDNCASVFDYGLQDWASQACGVGKDFLMTTNMIDDEFGLAGTMFDIKNISSDSLYITGWDLLLDQGSWDIQVYQTRISPTFVGNTFNGTNGVTNLNWRFFGQTTVSSSGVLVPTHIPLGGIILAPNASTGVYITSTRDWINGPISMQVSTPSAVISNCDLQLSAGIGLTNRAGLGFAQGQGDLIFGNTNQSGGANNTNYRLIEANIYYVPINKGIYQVDGTGLSSLSSFPVGPTLQALSFDQNGEVADAVCAFTVNVVEPTPPTFTSCPQDMIVQPVSLDCSAVVTYDLPEFTDNCLDRDLVLSLNKSDDITGRARCFNQQTGESPQSSHLRVFDLQNHSLVSPFQLTEVEVGISESNGSESATINLYQIHPDSSLVFANMSLLHSQSFTPPSGLDFVHPVAMNASVPADRNLVVELVDPDNSVFVAGYTEEGAGTSYFVGCGFPEPTDLRSINCVRRHFYAKVSGNSTLPLTLEQTDSSGLSSGSVFPGGTTLQEYTATDASGNTAICSFLVTVDSDLDLLLVPTSTSCATNEGTITTTPNGGLAPYTYLWSNGSTEQNLSNLSPGTYSLTLTDANDCTTTAETTIEGDLAPVITLLEAQPTLCGNNNGSATVTANGFHPPLVYEWSNGSAETEILDLGPGIYSVTVSDSLGCVTSGEVEVPEIPGPSIVSLTSLPTYCGNDNGSAEVVAAGDNGPFSIEWSNGATDSLISDLGPGIYTVSITDANLCTTVGSVEVEEIQGPTLEFIIASPSTCGGADGTAEVLPSGNGPFAILWGNGITDPLVTGLPAGVYPVEVTDSLGCVTNQSVEVSDLPGPELVLSSTLPSGCIIGDGTATVTPLGSTPFAYEWSTGATDSVATGLLPDLYEVVVTDGNSCVSVGTILVETPPGAELSIVTTPPTTCQAADATAAVVAVGIWPYTFNWSNGSTDSVAINLVAGGYSVEVLDAVGCVSSASALIESVTDLAIPEVQALPALCGEPNGSASVTVTGGNWPYSFEWSNGGLDSLLLDLPAGTYVVSVTDVFGCEAESAVTVGEVASPTIDSLNSISAYCGLANGAAEVFISGGTGNYDVEWSNGVTFPAITDLLPGEYSIVVTDENDCAVTGSVVVGDDPGQEVSISLVQQPTACVADDGSLEVAISGGVWPYSITWSNGSVDSIQQNLPAGVYSVVVVDAAGCTVETSYTLTGANDIVLDWSSTIATCGNSNGTANANFSGGEGALQYIWSLNGDVLESDTADVPFLFFTGLEGGLYELQIFDSTGCAETAAIEVIQEEGPTIVPGNTPAICGQENGSAWVEITGGTYPYTFVWDNGESDSLLVNVAPGEYAIAVLDGNNCISTGTVIVEDLVAPIVVVDIVHANCGLENGEIFLGIQASTPEFDILWSNGDSTELIDSLGAGEFSAVIVDQNGCETLVEGLIVEEQADTEAPTFVVCPLDIEVHSCNSVIEYDQPDATDNCGLVAVELVEGLPSGSDFPVGETLISYQAGDQFGNTAFCDFTITRIEDLELSNEATPVSCFGGNDGIIALSITGGTPPYDISWSNGQTSDTLNDLSFGLYSGTVTDQGDCLLEFSILVEEPAPIAIALDSIVPETPPCLNGAIFITTAGGTPALTFTWTNLDDPDFSAETQDLEGIAGGVYECLVTDANGCVQTSSTFVVEDCTVATKEQNSGPSFELFPNPSNGLVTLEWSGPNAGQVQLILLDSRGVQLMEQQLNDRPYELDLSAYANGVYWVQIRTEAGSATRRVVLTK
ncbi:MAG: HYR domain-containing protein [Saprospirales bacterium]|nr:HYR domain-containing protein [Saprospirales bacterium]